MTNQTIDGVPGLRALLAEIYNHHGTTTGHRDRLCALLMETPVTQPQGEPVGFRYRANGGPWELMDESPFSDGRMHYRENGEELEPVYAEQPAPVALTQDAIDRIVPSLNLEPDRDEFHCEWALWSDRERIRSKLSTLLTANPAPVAVVMPVMADHKSDDRSIPGSMEDESFSDGWNACLDEVTRLNTK